MKSEFDDFIEEEAEVEQENFVPYLSPTASADEVLRQLEACPICCCKLHFTNFTDFARMVSHEVVRCGECGYQAKKDMTQLQ